MEARAQRELQLRAAREAREAWVARAAQAARAARAARRVARAGEVSSFDNMNSNVSNAFFKQKVQITELQLDVTEKRREIKALASLLEKAGVKKSKIEKMRAEAKEVARIKRSRDEKEIEQFITSQPNSSKSSKSIKKVKRVRKHETKRARSAYNYYQREMLTACESTKTRNNMRGGASAWKEIKGEKEGRAKKYYDMAKKYYDVGAGRRRPRRWLCARAVGTRRGDGPS